MANPLRLAGKHAVGVRYTRPRSQAATFDEPATLSIELGLDLTGASCR